MDDDGDREMLVDLLNFKRPVVNLGTFFGLLSWVFVLEMVDLDGPSFSRLFVRSSNILFFISSGHSQHYLKWCCKTLSQCGSQIQSRFSVGDGMVSLTTRALFPLLYSFNKK